MLTEKYIKIAREKGVAEDLIDPFLNFVNIKLMYLGEDAAIESALKAFLESDYNNIPGV